MVLNSAGREIGGGVGASAIMAAASFLQGSEREPLPAAVITPPRLGRGGATFQKRRGTR